MPRINETLIFMLAVYFVQSENNGVCHPEKSNKCCAQFYLAGDTCLPCNGSFGIHCSSSCPRGYCRYHCSTQCSCDDCDSLTCECSDSQKSNDDRSAASKRFDYELIILGIGLIVLGISIAAFIRWIYKRENVPLEVNSDLTQENYVEYDMIRESQLILDDDDDGDDDVKIHTVQTRGNVDKPRRLSSDGNSEGSFYNELRYNSC